MSENDPKRDELPGRRRSMVESMGATLRTREKLTRRGEIRYPVKEVVQYEFSGKKEPENLGVLLNVSRSGMRIASCEPIPEGTLVAVTSKSYEATCEVRNCLATTETSFEIGLKIVSFRTVPKKTGG